MKVTTRKFPLIKPTRFTQEGFDKFKAEYEELEASRPAAVDDLRRAREMGDLSENGWYKGARAKLSSIDARLFKMSLTLKTAQIIDSSEVSYVDIGCTITLKNDKREMTYHIVGDVEADPSEGKLSLLSPIGKAVSGKREGDEIEIEVPAGKITYKISKISW